MTIVAYRIIKREFAASLWSGDGARIHGGRWNSRGVAVIYAAENRSLAAMEQLVHLVKPRVLNGYLIASITFVSAQVQRVDLNALPAGWDGAVAPAALRQYGDNWARLGKHPVLAVPSAVIPGEWNYLINPAHRGFGSLVKSIPMPFMYDARLK